MSKLELSEIRDNERDDALLSLIQEMLEEFKQSLDLKNIRKPKGATW